MKPIQWFPGHMAKAMRMMEENLSLVDGVIVVLDARCPASSFNPRLKRLTEGKPILYVLCKSDLADGKADGVLAQIRSCGAAAIKINCKNALSRRDITGAIDKIVAEKRERALQKGRNKTFRFMVVGAPNTGKSTLINLIAGGKRAETGDKAGVTRGKQWIRLPGYELLDTPGTTPPALENQQFAARLAYVGSLNDDILDLDDIALMLLDELWCGYPERLTERYGITGGTALDMLNDVCKKRGLLLRGGEFDYERGVRAVIDDFRKGKLGKITLDSALDAAGLDY